VVDRNFICRVVSLFLPPFFFAGSSLCLAYFISKQRTSRWLLLLRSPPFFPPTSAFCRSLIGRNSFENVQRFFPFGFRFSSTPAVTGPDFRHSSLFVRALPSEAFRLSFSSFFPFYITSMSSSRSFIGVSLSSAWVDTAPPGTQERFLYCYFLASVWRF